MSDLELLDLLVEQNKQMADKLRLLEKSVYARELKEVKKQ